MIIFLDRDGTINEFGEGYITDPMNIKLIPGTGEAIRIFNSFADYVIVVTNQSIIGKGLANHQQVRALHTRIDEYMIIHNAHIDHYLYCFHHEDEGCTCRKPNTKMLRQAKLLYDFDPKKCWMIGDNKSDIEFGQNSKMKTALVETGIGFENKKLCKPDYVFKDLLEAAKQIKEMTK